MRLMAPCWLTGRGLPTAPLLRSRPKTDEMSVCRNMLYIKYMYHVTGLGLVT
jgi:hypothetical protein